jgi:hypothetical protein
MTRTELALNSCLISCLMCPYFSHGLTFGLTLHLMSRCDIGKWDDLHKYKVSSTYTRRFCECFMDLNKWQSPSPPLPPVSSSNYCALNPVTLQSTISKHHCEHHVAHCLFELSQADKTLAQDRSSKQLLGLGSQCPLLLTIIPLLVVIEDQASSIIHSY